MHFSICKSEMCIIYDGFICFFRNPICNLDRDVWTFSWIWLFRAGSYFLFSFIIYFLCFKIIFYLKLDSDFNNSGLFAIICATYRMDLVHMFHEFLVQPSSTYNCQDTILLPVICFIFSRLSETHYNRAESPGKLISFIKWLRQYHIDIPYNSKFCLYSSNSPLEFAQSNQKLFSDLLLFLNCVRFFSIAGFGAGFHCLMVAFGGRLVLLLLRH